MSAATGEIIQYGNASEPEGLFTNAVDPDAPIEWGGEHSAPLLLAAFHTEPSGRIARIEPGAFPLPDLVIKSEGTYAQRTVHVCDYYATYPFDFKRLVPCAHDFRKLAFVYGTANGPVAIHVSCSGTYIRYLETTFFPTLFLRSGGNRCKVLSINSSGVVFVRSGSEVSLEKASEYDRSVFGRTMTVVLEREPLFLTPDRSISAALELVSNEQLELVRERRRQRSIFGA